MRPESALSLLEILSQLGLLEPEQFDLVRRELLPRCADAKDLARELLLRGWLTAYQANQLLQSKGAELVLGSYVLLERLGEGGMGTVFKARHRTLGRTVALKLIRKDRLANAQAARRFEREIRAAAQLNHPNVVLAFDADEVHGNHFFTMEFVTGTDLSKLIQKEGPLPIERACDYVRQAALGLQHAHERGLVHRDIKPANLLLAVKASSGRESPEGVVKILDMGLARLGTGDDGVSASTLTQEGSVMGTPDYIAPEQAREAHDVDIRADLYSLGCTLYFLLAGRPPFPTGTLGSKLIQHQLDEPTPVEQQRPEVPPTVAAVVRKLMAKKPEDRYQTPAEVATALQVSSGTNAGATPPVTAAKPVASSPATDTSQHGSLTFPGEVVRQRRRQSAEQRRLLVLSLVGGGVLLSLLGLLAFLLLRPGTPTPTSGPVAQSTLPRMGDAAFDAWVESVRQMPADQQVTAVAAKLKERNPQFDGQVKPRIEGEVVTGLALFTDEVVDLTPLRALSGLTWLDCRANNRSGRCKLADLEGLRGLKLTTLICVFTQVVDLKPLQGMPLTHLNCTGTPVTDLKPLAGLPLSNLACDSTPITDLTPLKGLPLTRLAMAHTSVTDLSPLAGLSLTTLDCQHTSVTDLSPLRGLPLTTLYLQNTFVTDLSPLENAPLKSLDGNFLPHRDAAILRRIKTLEQINYKPPADFFKELEAQQAAFDAWLKEVPGLPPDKQVEAVAAQLKKFNPRFDGTLQPTIDGGAVTRLSLSTDTVTDLTPLRALPKLAHLTCAGSGKRGRLTDLSPLRGLPLQNLRCSGNPGLVDLKPLEGMPLLHLEIHLTGVKDLTPLRGMKLRYLLVDNAAVTDLSPLQGMPLGELQCSHTAVADLTPLQGMPLTSLRCKVTRVADLTPLQGLPLTYLDCSTTKVTDLTPLRGMKLTTFACYHTNVTDLTPLQGMPLTDLDCGETFVADLTPLQGMKLKKLNLNLTRVTDLTPLQGMPLEVLNLAAPGVTDLSPLKDLPLVDLVCPFRPERDAALLRGIKSLQRINGQASADFWRAVDARRPKSP